MASTPRFEQEQADAAAAEAAGIGGVTGEEYIDPAQLPITEAGGGVSEGFEESEQALIEHASHGDQQSAHAILHDRGHPEEESLTREDSESDHERSSELGEDSGTP
jgi:hypothetical protein